ncbi:MAG: ABC transporter substrate-binding protein [Bacteroidota bacterium]
MTVFVSSCNEKKSATQTTTIDNLLSCSLPNSEFWDPSWSDSNVVNVHILADPDNLHPTNGSSQIRDEVLMYLHQALLTTDLDHGCMKPGICESMPVVSPDEKTLTFKIKKGITWDNQQQVLPEDVIFTIKASKCKLTNNVSNKFFFENIQDVIVDKNDSLTFKIIFKTTSSYNIPMWCDYPILQSRNYDCLATLKNISFLQLNDSSFLQETNKELKDWAKIFNSDAMGDNPEMINGLGAYQLEKWERGQFISIVKKKNHWSDKISDKSFKAYPQKIIFRIAQDPSVQKNSFINQLYDASGAFPTRLLLELKKDDLFNKNYHSKFVDTYGYTYIAINTRPDGFKQPFILNDINVRKALAFSSPIDEMIKVVNKGINKRVAGPVAPLKLVCNKELSLIPFDLKKANQFLAASGWVDINHDGIREKKVGDKVLNLSLQLIYMNTIPDWKEMAMIIAEGMKNAGIQIQLIPCDYPTWLEKVTSHNYDLAMGSWNTSSFPEDYSQLWSTDSYFGNGSNYTGFGNSTTDSLIYAIAKETDAKKKVSLEKKMQKLIYDEQPYIFMYQLVRRCVLHKRFDNAKFYAERPGIIYSPLQINTLHYQSSVNN